MQNLLSFSRNGINYHVFRFTNHWLDSDEGSIAYTVKDVGAKDSIHYALRRGANVIVDVTSGNYGQALAQAVMEYNSKTKKKIVKAVHIVSPKIVKAQQHVTLDDLTLHRQAIGHGWRHVYPYPDSIPFVFEDYDEIWLPPEKRIQIAREVVKNQRDPNFTLEGVIDVTHHLPHSYWQQANQVLDSRHLDYLAVPVGTGRVFVSFYRALENSSNKKTKLVGIAPEGENPVYGVFVRKRGKKYVIENFNAKSSADKLSCPQTDLLPEIMDAIANGHSVMELDEESIKKANIDSYEVGNVEMSEENKLLLEQSASVGFVLVNLRTAESLGIKRGSNVGIFTTGFGLHAAPSWLLDIVKQHH